MSERIKALKIPNENYHFIDEKKQSHDQIQNFSKINIFVGENNSGKSRLLRSILSNEINWIPSEFSLKEWNETIENIHRESLNYLKTVNWRPEGDFENKIQQLKVDTYCGRSGKFSAKYKEYISLITSYKNRINVETMSGIKFPIIGQNLLVIFQDNTKKFEPGFENNLDEPSSKIVYIPILRGLVPINSPVSEDFDQTDVYQKRILKDYFGNTKEKFEIFTGLDTFQKLMESKLGFDSEQEKIESYQKFLSTHFFEGKMVKLTPHAKTKSILIKIGDEPSREIYNLGDGLQTIIILTLPLFLNLGEKMLIFIEEPEKLLHPGLQRKLIDTFLNQPGFESFQFFMTTHSNHFLDITLDFTQISIYSVRKRPSSGENMAPTFLVENLSNGDSASLELLGVRNSSVFLSNCTIWVEGITDRKYFRKFLELYKQNNLNSFLFEEDLHYSFVEYGGSNITHWSFLNDDSNPIDVNRLCGKLLLIADNPGNQTKKLERHKKLKEKLGTERFIELKCKEVENLLPPKTIIAVLSKYGESIDSIPDFNHKEYFNKSLGKFLDDRLKAVEKHRKGAYSDGDTISDKVKFCEYAISSIETWNDLSKESQEITEKIVAFITKNNT